MKLLTVVGLALTAGSMVVPFVAGCADDNSGGELSRAAPDPDLVRVIAPSKPHMDYIDLAGTREQLGLAADEEVALPTNAEEMPTPERLLLANIASHLLVHIPRPNPAPVADAIDGASVSAGATPSVVSAEAVAALRTSQPFDDLAARLEDHGYQRRGDIVINDSADPIQPFFPALADGDDGLIILAGSAEAAERALTDPGVPSGVARLLDDIGGVVKQVDVSKPQRGCVTSIAIGQDLDPAVGEIVVSVANDVSKGAFILDDGPEPGDSGKVAAPPGVEFHTVEANGGVLRAKFTYNLDGYSGGPVGLFRLALSPGHVYRC